VTAIGRESGEDRCRGSGWGAGGWSAGVKGGPTRVRLKQSGGGYCGPTNDGTPPLYGSLGFFVFFFGQKGLLLWGVLENSCLVSGQNGGGAVENYQISGSLGGGHHMETNRQSIVSLG